MPVDEAQGDLESPVLLQPSRRGHDAVARCQRPGASLRTSLRGLSTLLSEIFVPLCGGHQGRAEAAFLACNQNMVDKDQ